MEKPLSMPSINEIVEKDKEPPAKNAFTQTDSRQSQQPPKHQKIFKKWTTFPFRTSTEPKIPKRMTVIPSEDTLSCSSSTSSDTFLPENQIFANFNAEKFPKVFFYSSLTRSSTSRSKLSSFSSRTESLDKEKIIPRRRKSLDSESGKSEVASSNAKPRPRSWLETSKNLTKNCFNSNKFNV